MVLKEVFIMNTITNNTGVQSKIGNAMNRVAGDLTSVEIERYENTEIIHIGLRTCSDIHIDTAKSVCVKSNNKESAIKTLAKKNRQCKNIINNQCRDSVVLSIGGYKNNTRIALAKLIALALDYEKNGIRITYSGLHANHKDRTGNDNIYGYTNNRCYNIELVEGGQDERHWPCIRRLQELTGIHYAFSANNEKAMNACEFMDDEQLINWINKQPYVLKGETRYI